MRIDFRVVEAGPYRRYNNAVADLCRRYPDPFVAFSSVDARDGMSAVRELNRAMAHHLSVALSFP